MKKITRDILKLLPLALAIYSISLPATAGDAAAGKALYNGGGACATCHGATGAGDGAAAAAFNPKPSSFATAAFRIDTNGDGKAGTDTDLANTIKNGAAKYGGNAGMPGRADFSDSDIGNIIAYIRALKK